MNKRYQVFVSSTYTDLIEERSEVIRTILSCHCFPVGMELFPAEDKKQWDVIKHVIDESDFYLLIIGGRYGSTCQDGGSGEISYTEKEFDYAVSAKKDILAFLIDESVLLTADRIDKESYKRQYLAKFREKVKTGRMTKEWKNKDNLSAAVFQSLNTYVGRNDDCDSRGWIRASDVVIDKLDLPRDFQIFITGSYGVGKSTVAEEIMNRTNIQLIQKTDVIKYALRGFIDKRNANIAERKKNSVNSEFNMQNMDAILDEFLVDDKLIGRMVYDCDEEEFKNQCSLMLKPITRIGDDLAKRKIPSIIDGINFPVEILTERSEGNRMFINLYVDDITILSRRLKNSYDSRMDPASADRNVEIREKSMEIINTYFKNEYDKFIKNNNEPPNLLNIKTDNIGVGQVACTIIDKMKKYVYP